MVLANFCASGSSFWITMIIFSRISKSSFPGFLFFPRSRFNILQSILLYLEDNIQLQGFVSLVSKDEDSECREDLDSDRREDFVGVTFF
ncbi:uncharacterized protein LOC131333102 isoform X2 [Rhododendron vialii]|uniref:uncharacterized protein LOC131333102 isoform X2 n=1 Tax=Rhododendron vialii TaxID=182163 RepID=UPI00265FC3D6|nr:uncharacterized protein LOC131333102 isoform X2 [Rhododendron vialii]